MTVGFFPPRRPRLYRKQRRCPKIQLCPTCGRMRVWHSGGYWDCPVPAEVVAALRAFRRDHGRHWKSQLCALWASGEPPGAYLGQARALIGPKRLYKIKI